MLKILDRCDCNNDNTLKNDDDLLIPVGANEVWYLEFQLLVNISVAGDARFTIAVPAAGTGYWVDHSGISNLGDRATIAPIPLATLKKIDGDGVLRWLFLYAIAINGGNAGNIQLQWAQWIADASDCIVLENSILRAWQVA